MKNGWQNRKGDAAPVRKADRILCGHRDCLGMLFGSEMEETA